MEGESGSEGDYDRKRSGSDDNSNEKNNDDGSNRKIANSSEGQSRPKRKMKTPFQLETLEKAYALETYPSEATRFELSEKLGLSDRQLQMWFCHRRLKDKKDLQPKKPLKKKVTEAEPLPDSPTDDLRLGPELGKNYGSGSGSGSSPYSQLESRNLVPRGVPRYYESPSAELERRAIAHVEAQLGEPLRSDGPILGIEFDTLPPDAFGAPLVTEQQRRPSLAYDSKIYERHDVRAKKAMTRTFHEDQFLQSQSSFRSDAFRQFSQSPLHDPTEGPAGGPPFHLEMNSCLEFMLAKVILLMFVFCLNNTKKQFPINLL